MGAIGLNPIRLDAIGLDPIRFNAIKLGVPGASFATDRPYISPDVLSSLAGVWIADGKSNTDPDRNIIKNKLPGRGGDLEILNAAYEGMSGCNGYPVVFGANKTWRYEAPGGGSSYIYTINDNKYNFTQIYTVAAWAYSYIKRNGELTDYNKDVTSFKIKVTGLEPDKFLIKYNYLSSTDATVTSNIVISSDGIYELPKSFANDGSLIDNYGWVGFGFAKRSTDIPNTITGVNITIEVLPEYEGAFVTDGVDDMIVSQNPVSEMLGGSKELTVVSMIHQISPVPDSYGFTNYIREGSIWSRTNVKTSGKTGIYGYKISKGNTEVGASNLIDNILGDKADYEAMGYNTTNYSDINYSVTGYIKDGSPTEVSSVAWYWTFIAKRALTTDEINQVIAYYNLDKYVKPDIYYNVKKQGLTNDTPDEDWYLKDFSGNGRDMTLYNYARTPESGINEEGGLQSDGVDDYGQFVGDLGLKDYTVIIDRAYPIVSERQYTATSDATGENSNTPFLLEHIDAVKDEYAYSYLAATAISINKEREICYQSTYQYKDTVINRGSSTSLGSGLTIARYGINNGYSALVLYSFMLFHYSMSKFLIERQLKKRKLGTLYPGMVEFRPIVKSNIPYSSISYSVNPGEYVIEGSTVTITITLSNSSDKLVDISSNAISDISISGDNGIYEVTGKITKSPQKINIVISSYLTMLDNETLISNETLIKNE